MTRSQHTTGPTNLHLGHSWGGGLSLWIDDFCRTDALSDNLLLESVGDAACYGLSLRLRRVSDAQTLGCWTLQQPISEVRAAHAEYRAILADICSDYNVDHIYVSSFIGQSLDVLTTGIDTTIVYHDYFPYCPAFFATRDAPCLSCNAEDLHLCRSHPVGLRPKASPSYYSEVRDAYFSLGSARHLTHVAPCTSVPRVLRQLDRRFDAFDFRVVEHGIPHTPTEAFAGAEEQRRLRIGVLGDLQWYKGRDALERCFEAARTFVDFYFFGPQDPGLPFAGRFGSHYIGPYRRDSLPALLKRHPLDLALFYPVVPETFAYTLSEVWCCGVPPLARDLGAHGERITHDVNGFLFGLDEDALVESLLALDGRRSRIRSVASRLQSQEVRSVSDMVCDYYAMRRGIVRRIEARLEVAARRAMSA